MAVFPWDPELTVGVKEIDGQHQKLVGLINTFLEALLEGQGAERALHLLTGLEGYVQVHFETEERYFDLFNYPQAKRHVEEHRWFRGQVHDLRGMLNRGDPSFSARAVKLLKTWFANHVKKTDMLYTDFFRRHGLT